MTVSDIAIAVEGSKVTQAIVVPTVVSQATNVLAIVLTAPSPSSFDILILVLASSGLLLSSPFFVFDFDLDFFFASKLASLLNLSIFYLKNEMVSSSNFMIFLLS